MLDRRHAVARLLEHRGNLLVVSGLGAPTYDVAAAGDDPRNFYLWGAMGGAAMVGLGLALAQPERRVLVVTGDGEMLMGLGSLATIALMQPKNLAIVVLDNSAYGETGMQESHTAKANLAAIARASGFALAVEVLNVGALGELARQLRDLRELTFASIRIAAREHERVLPLRDGEELKERFMAAL
jgi:thiamine pyrophosphate-dependent acetolactate synthase large subunit-like protein